MSQESNELYEKTMKMLKPALDRVATDAHFRQRLETHPLAALAELNVELDAETRQELEGKRFSEFWALRRAKVAGPVESRDLPPPDGELNSTALKKVSGGMVRERFDGPSFEGSVPRLGIERFAPPYVPY